MNFNPRTYTQSHTPTMVQGGVDGIPPCVFDMLQYFETILPSVESLWSSPQDEGSLMGGGADGGLWRHQKWSPSWILLRIRNRVKTVRLDGFHSDVIYGRPFVSKLWHDIRAVFPTYTCNHSCYAIYVRFIPKYMTIFLQTRIYMRTKKPIYMRYKQACGIWGHRKSSYKRHRIIPSPKSSFMYDGPEK